MTKHAGRSRLFKTGLASAAVGMILAVTGMAIQPANAVVDPNYPYPVGWTGAVTICHGTNSNSHPYEVNTPNASGVGGTPNHYSHTGPVWNPTLKALKIAWGDIIPPLPGTANSAGLNWDAVGEAIWRNDCQPVTPTIGIAKTPAAFAVEPGDTLAYDIVVTAGGTGPSLGVTVSDTLNSDYTWTENSTSCSITTYVMTCNVGTLASGAEFSVGVSTTSAAGVCRTVDNTATVDATNITGSPDDEDSTDNVITIDDGNSCEPTPATGDLSVGKVVTGNNLPPEGTEFSFAVDCTTGDDDDPVDLNGVADGTQATFDLTADDSVVLSGIPTGATCTVAETATQEATATSITVDGGTPTAGTQVEGVVIGDDTTVAVVVTNTFTTSGGCVPSSENNSCCPAGQTSDGQGGCTSGGCTQSCGQTFDQCPLIPGDQPVGTDCTPPLVVVVDECPDDLGLQTNPDQCSVPEVITAELITPEVQVEGVQIVRSPSVPALPRTGSDPMPLLEIGFGLILLGAGAVLFGRQRPVVV